MDNFSSVKTPTLLKRTEQRAVVKHHKRAEIFKSGSLPEKTDLVEGVTGFDWHISTKYYTADVLLCATGERTIGDRAFAEAVEAFVVCFDADQDESFKLVKAWTPYLEQIEPEVKMLVCDRCTEKHKVPRLEVQTWCIDNGFELVELNPEVEAESDDVEDDFLETTGIDRVIQALHAHTWSNLQMIENPSHHSPYIRKLMQEEFESRLHSTPDIGDPTSPGDDREPVTDGETNTRTNNKIQDQSNHTENNCKSEQTTVIATGDVKNEIVRTLSSQASASNVSDKNVEKLSDQACASGVKDENSGTCDQGRTSNKHSTDTDVLVDNKGDAKEAEGKLPKSVEKNKKDKPVKPPSKEETLDSLLQSSDMALFDSLGDEDPGGESFEKLFERFARMKDQASNLPPAERKKYAEQVTIAFWRAMGGDEDEIGNLSDSD